MATNRNIALTVHDALRGKPSAREDLDNYCRAVVQKTVDLDALTRPQREDLHVRVYTAVLERYEKSRRVPDRSLVREIAGGLLAEFASVAPALAVASPDHCDILEDVLFRPQPGMSLRGDRPRSMAFVAALRHLREVLESMQDAAEDERS